MKAKVIGRRSGKDNKTERSKLVQVMINYLDRKRSKTDGSGEIVVKTSK